MNNSYGSGKELKGRPTLDDFKKFFEHLEDIDGHWIWKRAKNEAGYGRIWWKGMWPYVHRFAYVAFRGKLKDGEDVHHKCKKRLCCNPWHIKKCKHDDHPKEKEILPF